MLHGVHILYQPTETENKINYCCKQKHLIVIHSDSDIQHSTYFLHKQRFLLNYIQKYSNLLTLLWTGGGRFPPPPQVLGSGCLYIDLRGSKVWHNSYFIMTMEVQNVQNLKGVPKKIWSMFFEAGVKNQNFKLEPITLKFCMGLQGPNTNFFCFLDHIDLGPYSKDMAVLK